MQNPVPANVVKAIDYYQGPGWGQPLEAGKGFHGKIVNINLVEDNTISHIGMDKREGSSGDFAGDHRAEIELNR